MNRLPRQKFGKSKKQQWRAQDRADPEPPRHIDKLGIRFFFKRDGAGFERHAADWTRSRLIAYGFGMHGTNVLGPARRQRSRAFRLQRHPAFGTRPRLAFANLRVHRTNVDGSTMILFGGSGTFRHATT